MTNRFGKTMECHTTRAETVILDDEETAIDDCCKFTLITISRKLKLRPHPMSENPFNTLSVRAVVFIALTVVINNLSEYNIYTSIHLYINTSIHLYICTIYIYISISSYRISHDGFIKQHQTLNPNPKLFSKMGNRIGRLALRRRRFFAHFYIFTHFTHLHIYTSPHLYLIESPTTVSLNNTKP